MIKLIKNELNKIFSFKYIIISLLFITSVFIVIYYNRDIEDASKVLNTSLYMIPFIGMITCLLTGGIMSNEFQNGTIRMYLTKPVKRWKILLSKLLAIYLIIFYYLFIVLISYILFESIYFDIKSVNIIIFLKDYFLYSIPVIFIGTLSLFLSTITISTSFSVGITCFIYLMASIIAQILFGIKFNIIQYTFLPYLDFTIFQNMDELNIMNSELGINLNVNNGIIILTLSTIILYLITNATFNKKDIKN